MSDHVHILITGDEGKGRSFLLAKNKIKVAVTGASVFLLTFALISFSAYNSISTNITLSNQVAKLENRVKDLSGELNSTTDTNKSLALQVTDLKKQNSTQKELFQQEKATLLNTAVTELEERSDMIERIMCNIGVDIKDTPPADRSNSGGPYIMPQENVGKELLYRSDTFLDTIHHLPLGRPVPGSISSGYGHRIDPVNGRRGFHEGVDFRGRSGDPIKATADGTVVKAFRNGGYGKYIEINHGNGYVTKFAHLKKMLVKRGDKVKRGQVIAQLGNTGRSTGSHLHYEIVYKGKPVNPSKFMHAKKLKQAATIKTLSADTTVKVKHLQVATNDQAPPSPLEN